MCKQNVRKLGVAVSHGVAVAVGERQVVEADALFGSVGIGRSTRYDDDPRLPAEIQPIEQPVRENEVTEMIDREMPLDAVDQFAVVAAAAVARIADQNIDRELQRPNLLGAGNDGLRIGEFELERTRHALDAIAGRLRPIERATRAQHIGAAQGQHAHRLETDSRGAAGDNGDLVFEVDALGDFLGGRFGIERAPRDVGGRCLFHTTARCERRSAESGNEAPPAKPRR